jgi:transcriptional regulator with XRE-family HTH domain
MVENQSLGKRLESLIKTLNMKKGEFADKAGISQSLISNVIAGKNGASKSTINLICITYNVSREWLINGQGSMFNEKPDIDRLYLSPIIEEMLKLYDRLLPDTQKTVREYIYEMYELQELRKQISKTDVNFPAIEPEPSGEKAVHPIHEQKRA